MSAGAYRGVRAWWSREHWRSELYADLAGGRGVAVRAAVGTRGAISLQACAAVAGYVAGRADGRTGRNAMPSEDEIIVATGYGETTVEKAIAVLATLGWVKVIRTGKNWLSAEDRRELHRAHSKARQRRPVYACTYPADLAFSAPSSPTSSPSAAADTVAAEAPADPATTTAVDNPHPGIDHERSTCALPTTRSVCGVASVPLEKNFTPERASMNAPAGLSPTRTANRRTYRADPRVVRLTKDLRARIPWLTHVPHQRLMPSLHRYAVAGWTARELQAHLDRLLASRGWTVPGRPAELEHDSAGRRRARTATTMTSPYGYLAFLLRQIDPTDLALDQAHEAAQRATEAYQRQLIYGTPCPHGQPAGDVPSPTKGIRACPLCRRRAASPVS